MKKPLLKSMLGKYITSGYAGIVYCHIYQIIIVDGNKAIAVAIIKNKEDKYFHWFIETEWTTTHYGFHDIKSIKILRKDELNG